MQETSNIFTNRGENDYIIFFPKWNETMSEICSLIIQEGKGSRLPQQGAILSPWEHRAMCEDIFSHNWALLLASSRYRPGLLNSLQCTGQPPTKNYQAPNINSAKFENFNINETRLPQQSDAGVAAMGGLFSKVFLLLCLKFSMIVLLFLKKNKITPQSRSTFACQFWVQWTIRKGRVSNTPGWSNIKMQYLCQCLGPNYPEQQKCS